MARRRTAARSRVIRGSASPRSPEFFQKTSPVFKSFSKIYYARIVKSPLIPALGVCHYPRKCVLRYDDARSTTRLFPRLNLSTYSGFNYRHRGNLAAALAPILLRFFIPITMRATTFFYRWSLFGRWKRFGTPIFDRWGLLLCWTWGRWSRLLA